MLVEEWRLGDSDTDGRIGYDTMGPYYYNDGDLWHHISCWNGFGCKHCAFGRCGMGLIYITDNSESMACTDTSIWHGVGSCGIFHGSFAWRTGICT